MRAFGALNYLTGKSILAPFGVSIPENFSGHAPGQGAWQGAKEKGQEEGRRRGRGRCRGQKGGEVERWEIGFL